MTLYKSEKNWLEKVADIIPGIKSYRSHEHRRDTDKRLRDYLAFQIDALRKKVDDLKLDLTNQGMIGLLDDIDLTTRKLQRLSDSLRYASYGYTGVFDQVKMRDEELDRLYAFDLELIKEMEDLKQVTEKFISGETDEKTIREYNKRLESTDTIIQERKKIFDKPIETNV